MGFTQRSQRLVDVFVGAERIYALAGEWLALPAAILHCVLAFGAVEILALPAATLLLLVLIFSRVMPRVLSLENCYQIVLNAPPGYDNMVRLTARCEVAREVGLATTPSGIEMPRLQESVVLEGGAYGYGVAAGQQDPGPEAGGADERSRGREVDTPSPSSWRAGDSAPAKPL